MNDKGFTIVEFLASFTITMLIVVFLLEIVLELKNTYNESELKSEIANKNAVIATSLNSKLDKYKIVSAISTSGSECGGINGRILKVTVTTDDNYTTLGSSSFYIKVVSSKNGDTNNGVEFGNCDGDNPVITNMNVYMPEGVTIENDNNSLTTGFSNSSYNNSYLNVKFKVKSNKLEENIPFNYVYYY